MGHEFPGTVEDLAPRYGLRAVLPADEATELGRKITDGKKTAPTRPHPHAPASPGILTAAGPAAAAADKARGAVTGRGTG